MSGCLFVVSAPSGAGKTSLVNALLAAGLDEITAWALLLQWLADRYSETLTLERHAKRLLKFALVDLTDEQREAAGAVLSEWC